MEPTFHVLLTVALVGAISFIGVGFFAMAEALMRRLLIPFVSLSAGVLLGDVFLHIVPELSEENAIGPATMSIVLVGILASFAIEKVIHWRHCHMLPSADHYHPVGPLTLAADGIHNFIDGMLIAASFLVDPTVGVATAIAIALHEIPQEIGDFAILLYSGFTKKSALLWNAASAATALAGALFILVSHGKTPEFTYYLLPFAAGNFLYIAGADLLPELHKETRASSALLQMVCITIGILLMQALTFLE